jgi:exonuclease SbcC
VKLRRILLRRVPGIEPPFSIDELSPAVNVVVGPNGSGKTSLRKAVTAILWPKLDPSKRLEIESDWQDGARSLHADRDGGQVTWKENGDPTLPPPVPDVHLASCYTLGVADLLLGDDKTDQTIANDIRVAISGGYDVPDLLKRCFALPSQPGRRELKEYRDANAEYRKVQADQRDLAKEEARLATLRDDAEAAREAQAAIERIHAALDLHGMREELRSVEIRVTQLPEPLARLSANDRELLDTLESNFRRVKADIDRLGTQASSAEQSLRDTAIGERPCAQEELDTASARIRDLERVEASLAETERALASGTAKVEDARKRLRGAVDVEAVPPLTPPELEAVEQFVRRRNIIHDKREDLRQRIEALGHDETQDDAELLTEATNLLREWLASPWTGSARRRSGIIVVAVAAAVIGIALAFIHSLAWLGLAGAGIGALLTEAFSAPGSISQGNERRAREIRFLELKLEPPATWTAESVRSLLRELDRRLANARHGETAVRARSDLERQLGGLDEEYRELEAEGGRLRESVGIDACGDITLYEIVGACRQYREARAQLLELDADLAEFRRNRDRLRGQIAQTLGDYGIATAGADEDPAALGAKLTRLQRRVDEATKARDDLHATSAALADARRRLAESEQKIREFYDKRGIALEDRARFDALLEQLPAYTDLIAKRSGLRGRITELEGRLRPYPDLLAADEGMLIERRDDAKNKIEALDEISKEIGRIQQQIDSATKATVVTEALDRRATTRDALIDALEEAQLAAVGRLLLEQLDEEHEKQSRPAVLARAMEYFAAFTHNAYELALSDSEGGGFRARDTSKNRFVELSALSDGTRIQLLLAVRLAFATSEERDARVPLMLDEALSTSDPRRFRAVADALAILASEGRQIFYLTANPADVTAWQSATQANPSLDLEIVDLARIRWQQASVGASNELTLPARPALRSPEGLTAEEYGLALGVPPAVGHEPIESLHLFYVLRHDLALLHHLLEKYQIDTLGRWESFSRSGRAPDLLPTEVCRRVDALCACARAAHAAASIGRGRPIDDRALADSGAVSEKFMPAVRAVAQDVAHDAKRLLEVIGGSTDERVKRFHKGKLEALEESLRAQGYLDDRPPLEIADIYAIAVAAVKEHIAGGVLDQDACLALVDGLLAAFRYETPPQQAVPAAERQSSVPRQ